MPRFARLVTILSLGASLALAAPPILNAAYDGNLVKLKSAVETGADVNTLDKYGWSPLMWAAYYDYQPMVKYLLEQKGIQIDLQGRDHYMAIKEKASPLIIATYFGNPASVKMLLQAGANPNLQDVSGNSALSYATQFAAKPELKFDEILNLFKAPGGAAPEPPPPPPAPAEAPRN